MEREFNQFEHQHPLVFLEGQDDDERGRCEGCGEPILGPCYACQKCSLFIHKFCKEAPKEINHPAHPEHPPTLFNLPDVTHKCDFCMGGWGGMFYHCEICNFFIDLRCVALANTIDHFGHQHPLILQMKPASFCCDAGGTNHSFGGISYKCRAYHFWVHWECTAFPDTVKHAHEHPLQLTRATQVKFSHFKIYCDVCFQLVKQKNCVYYCSICRFVAHVDCARSKAKNMKSDNEEEATNTLRLPVADDSVDLMSLLLEQYVVLEESNIKTNLNKIDHDHEQPLTLFEANLGNRVSNLNELKGEEICNACLQRVSAPYFGCRECNFAIHKCCAALPGEIRCHSLHPIHSLTLSYACSTNCYVCNYVCNGFAYCCQECLFCLDVKCASLGQTIKHLAHKHLLGLKDEPDCRCNACLESIRGLAFQCHDWNFNMHIQCASLPGIVRHRYDEHDIILTYSPPDNASEEYICEICEKELNPKLWFYYCEKCEYAFHERCVCNLVDEDSNFKFTGSIDDGSHTRALTFVRKSKDKPPVCDSCKNPCDGLAFECEECNYNLHIQCCQKFL